MTSTMSGDMSLFYQKSLDSGVVGLGLSRNIFWPWEDPLKRKRRLDSALEWFIGAGEVQPWSDEIPWKKQLVIDGTTFNPPRLFDVRPAPPLDPDPATYIEYGKWRYRNSVLPRGEPLETAYGRKRGSVRFTVDVVIPVLTEPKWREIPTKEELEAEREATRRAFAEASFVLGPPRSAFRPRENPVRRVVAEKVWMSITPQEVFTLRPGVRRAKGKVVIGGLGLGWLLRKVAEKKSVREISIVELSKDLLNWYGLDMAKSIPKVSRVYQGDVYEEANAIGRDYVYLLDIWPGYGDAANDPQLRRFRQAGYDVWAWGEVS